MIHYSVIPMDVIFEGMDTYSPEFVEIEHQGVTLQVEPMDAKQARIVRLLSGNPQDYMKEQYTPGTVISYIPGFHQTLS
ncbi:YlzJ-like family protein [Paenibacillus hexagrammi]|uniref:YlzJ-like family protein n=1 Tax=Paenibacillus hexagrammi TaxID=2908839 RepID=A0ABY3SQL1_9BACL|nr:YlzJ-like family protein [Paenibacillus sp. YPD9-1]UJF35395.1 YlzJ-like family protein [Paenibacillus sp. YPD9-1]